jgi:hypothetical protein
MKSDFFKELKTYIVEEFEKRFDFIRYIRYYETLLQNKDKLKSLLDDCETWRINIDYQPDKDGYGYGDGKFVIRLWDYEGEEPTNEKYLDHYYEIELILEDMMTGYCTCTPDMPNYNHKHNCCGIDCDWYKPAFRLNKIEEVYGSFNGCEADLWKLEEKWEEHIHKYNEKKKQEKLKRIEEQIRHLEREREKLLK